MSINKDHLLNHSNTSKPSKGFIRSNNDSSSNQAIVHDNYSLAFSPSKQMKSQFFDQLQEDIFPVPLDSFAAYEHSTILSHSHKLPTPWDSDSPQNQPLFPNEAYSLDSFAYDDPAYSNALHTASSNYSSYYFPDQNGNLDDAVQPLSGVNYSPWMPHQSTHFVDQVFLLFFLYYSVVFTFLSSIISILYYSVVLTLFFLQLFLIL